MKSGEVATWGIGVAVVLVVVGLPFGLAAIPTLLGPEGYADRMPLRRALRWEVQRRIPDRVDGRDVLLVQGNGVLASGASPEESTDRLWLVERATGAVLGQHTAWGDLDPLAFQGGRLWVEGYAVHQALTLPALEPEATLEDLLADHPDLPWKDVEEVYFPDDTENVRLLAKDGFLWDLQPDLVTLTRLHHDTPVPSTPSLASMSVSEIGGEVSLPSGRVAILGTGSRRPALRVAEARGALETTEVRTPLDGFLGGSFLGASWQQPFVRPPEDLFVQHHGEDGGSFLLSRVSAREGLRWTRGEADWLPDGIVPGATTELVVAEDRGDLLFLWLERTPEGVWSGSDHFLVGVDPETGSARWLTAF